MTAIFWGPAKAAIVLSVAGLFITGLGLLVMETRPNGNWK